ncbi:hypothetical protein IEQ34_020076 [Dendrobium chrysotoxum]|uniref:Uncharacterized protein n=1 Tax=Dendrobium chrysotoxum TaxID=161865 RepID=A0AAV7FKF8_DENCH|nr:hypothetical protein IEQ34_020076 [Dendrobium chrysotoxum]
MASRSTKDAESQQPLLPEKPPLLRRQSTVNPPEDELSPAQKAISQTFQSTANLAKLLPTGTLLTFQVLAPLFTNAGNCYPINRIMTSCLVFLCALSCFILSFTDSFRDASGIVRYGFATFKGMWVIDGTAQLPVNEAEQYKIKFIDFVHGFMSVLVFAAVALLDRNFVSCFYPVLSEEMEQLIASLPVAMGVVGSGFFVAFPTTRHGIGFPLSAT